MDKYRVSTYESAPLRTVLYVFGYACALLFLAAGGIYEAAWASRFSTAALMFALLCEASAWRTSAYDLNRRVDALREANVAWRKIYSSDAPSRTGKS